MIYSSVAMALSESSISQWRVKYACSKIPVHLAGWFLMQIFLRVPPLWPTSRVWLYLLVLHLKVLHFLLHAATSHFLNDEEIKCTCRCCCCQQGLSLTLTPAQDLNQPTNVQITVKLHHFPLVIEKSIKICESSFATCTLQTHTWILRNKEQHRIIYKHPSFPRCHEMTQQKHGYIKLVHLLSTLYKSKGKCYWDK